MICPSCRCFWIYCRRSAGDRDVSDVYVKDRAFFYACIVGLGITHTPMGTSSARLWKSRTESPIPGRKRPLRYDGRKIDRLPE